MDYDNINTGALFKNDKEGNEKRPDYRGPLNVGGKELEVAAWLKTSKGGQKYLSLKVQEPLNKEGTTGQAPANDFDDAVPF